MNIEALAILRVPNAKLQLLLRMAKSLIRDAPSKQNLPVEAALAKLIAEVAEVDAAMSRRLRLRNPHLLARELEFDRAVDALWIFLREYLHSFAQSYGHAGLEFLSEQRKLEVELGRSRELADMARSLYEQLFAAAATNFVQLSLSAQAEEMAALLRIIGEDGLGDTIGEVFDARILDTLVACQAQYEELVGDRMSRDAEHVDDFRGLRRRLRWLIGRYKLALETLYDEDQPESVALIATALRPLVTVNALMARGSLTNTELDAELDAELVQDSEFDALTDEDQDVDADESANTKLNTDISA